VNDPHKRKSLGACDEFPWGVVLTERFDFRHVVDDPILKEFKVSCCKIM
jgi:hypothetical protein